jgi:hypothetical protein
MLQAHTAQQTHRWLSAIANGEAELVTPSTAQLQASRHTACYRRQVPAVCTQLSMLLSTPLMPPQPPANSCCTSASSASSGSPCTHSTHGAGQSVLGLSYSSLLRASQHHLCQQRMPANAQPQTACVASSQTTKTHRQPGAPVPLPVHAVSSAPCRLTLTNTLAVAVSLPRERLTHSASRSPSQSPPLPLLLPLLLLLSLPQSSSHCRSPHSGATSGAGNKPPAPAGSTNGSIQGCSTPAVC